MNEQEFLKLQGFFDTLYYEEVRKLTPVQVEYAMWYIARRQMVKKKYTNWRCRLDDAICLAWIIPRAIVRRDLPDWCRPLWGAIRKIDIETDQGRKIWLQRLSPDEVRHVEQLVLHGAYLKNRISYHEAEERAKG